MSAATSRIRRICGQGPILLMLQWVALLSVVLAAGFFHYRVELLLEPVTVACGGGRAGAIEGCRTGDGACGRTG